MIIQKIGKEKTLVDLVVQNWMPTKHTWIWCKKKKKSVNEKAINKNVKNAGMKCQRKTCEYYDNEKCGNTMSTENAGKGFIIKIKMDKHNRIINK